jgi:hypothetical protein
MSLYSSSIKLRSEQRELWRRALGWPLSAHNHGLDGRSRYAMSRIGAEFRVQIDPDELPPKTARRDTGTS